MTVVARTVLFILGLSQTLCFGQRQGESVRQVFTCLMHSNYQSDSQGICPICGFELVEATDSPKRDRVEIRNTRLSEWCADWVTNALKEVPDDPGADARWIIDGWVSLRGKESVPQLRDLLSSPSLECVGWSAEALGQLEDRKAIPHLRRLLGDDRIFGVEHDKLGNVLNARLGIAGALHRLGEEDGQEALLELLGRPLGYLAYAQLAARDTPEVRAELAKAAKSNRPAHRARAIAAQIELGISDNVDDAIEILENGTPFDRWAILRALRHLNSPKVQEALTNYINDRSRPRGERALAASTLAILGNKRYVDFVVDAAVRAMHSEDAQNEIVALAEIGKAKHLPLLQRIIEENPRNRAEAVAAALKVIARVERKRGK